MNLYYKKKSFYNFFVIQFRLFCDLVKGRLNPVQEPSHPGPNSESHCHTDPPLLSAN